MTRSKLDDDDYLDVLLEQGTIADIPALVAEIRILQKSLKAAEKCVETLTYQLRMAHFPPGKH